MEDNTKRTHGGSEQSSQHTVPHAPWQLEKDTEGLDNPGSQASSSSQEEKDEDKSSQGCGCKYF